MPTDFIHRFIPATDLSAPVALLLLHGTGGDEDDLIPIGEQILPGAAIISPRGKVNENGMNRYFARKAEGVFDQEDLKKRTDELARFIETAIDAYGLETKKIIAIGYSNGANIAWNMLLQCPGVLGGAILLRPMLPYRPEAISDLKNIPVLIEAGEKDQLVPLKQTLMLKDVLIGAGADVTYAEHAAGHQLTPQDIEQAKQWMQVAIRK